MDFASDNSLEECVIGVLSKQQNESQFDLYEDPNFNQTTHPIVPLKNRSQPTLDTESEAVEWLRPQAFTDAPEYFTSSSGCGIVRVGDINDSWLLGVFAAIAMHPDNLIENVFASESLEAFKTYGIFTCRFYKNAEWIYVTTDTTLAYNQSLPSAQMKASSTDSGHVFFGSTLDRNEMFIPFLEKAYAKLHGSYQSLHASDTIKSNGNSSNAVPTSVRILEAFVDCTGATAYRIDLHDERFGAIDPDGSLLWKKMERLVKKKAILTTQCKQLTLQSTTLPTETTSGILRNRQYIVLYTKQIGLSEESNVLRFVKLKNVWGRGRWKGDWGPNDIKWDEYAHVEANFRNDSECEIHKSKSGKDGLFWMLYEDFLQTFNELFCVNIVSEHENVYPYVIPSQWIGISAAGGPSKSLALGRGTSQLEGKKYRPTEHFIEKSKWRWISESEPSWHRNPQFRLTACEKTSNVVISLLQQDSRLCNGENVAIHFVLERLQPTQRSISYDFPRGAIVAEAHTNDSIDVLLGAPPLGSALNIGIHGTTRQFPDREILREDITLEANTVYHLIAYTDTPKMELAFFLRIFSPKPLRVERVPPMLTRIQHGRWRYDREAAQADEWSDTTAGGPLCRNLITLRHPRDQSLISSPACSGENLSWCKNPQFWVYIDKASLDDKQLKVTHVTLKIVLWKTSHHRMSANTTHRTRVTVESKANSHTEDGRRASEKSHLIGITAVRVSTNAGDGCECSADEVAGLLMKKETAVAGTPALVHYKKKYRQKTHTFQRERMRSPTKKSHILRKGVLRNGTSKSMKKTYSQCEIVSADAIEQTEFPKDPIPSHFPSPKLIVKPEEWCRVSRYNNSIWGCLFLKKIPIDWLLLQNEDTEIKSPKSNRSLAGLLIVPSTGESEIEGTFELQVDSTVPIQCHLLPQYSYRNCVGKWNENNAKGCHLHADEWQNNPKFFLIIKSVRPASVRITLTRSELEWSRKCKQDAVGSMIGFYVFPSAHRMHRIGDTVPLPKKGPKIPFMIHVDGRPWSETDFLPLYSVTSPPSLTLTATITDPYVILPATYAAGKCGQFVLSVQCDADFTFLSEEQYVNL